MHYICTGEEMQAVDAHSIQVLGIPGIVLMEKAAMSMETEILSRFPSPVSVLILVERGNNGGDGLALARLLMAKGYKVTVCEPGLVPKASESYLTQRNILDHLQAEIVDSLPDQDYDIYVDAVFGVGLKRDLQGVHKDLIEEINRRRGYKIAVDVPSGLDSTTGHILGCGFKADLTITFGLMKRGLVLYPGAEYAGEVLVKDIGFPKEAVDYVSPGALGYDREDLSLLPVRKPWSNKGSYGKVLIIAGSKNMAGAAYLSALAAYRSGCGLVRIFTCEDNRQILQTLLPEAIMTTYENMLDVREIIEEVLDWADVIGIGPGLGQNESAEHLLTEVLEHGRVPLVIDADGINTLASFFASEHESRIRAKESFDHYQAGIILTPHLKEMERLSGLDLKEIQQNLIQTARDFGKPDHVLVLKDARTIVSDGTSPIYINESGNHGMAVGGSGDILTGIICGFLAGGLPLVTAARLAVYCHGLAGDEAAADKGYYGLKAIDEAEYLGKVIG